MDFASLFGGRQGLFQAIDPSVHSVSLVDMRREDTPLVYVNRGFEKLTGYVPEEVIGRNCRLLQGRDTDRETVDRLRQAMMAGAPFLADLNYRKSGEAFWNRLSLRPIRNGHRDLTHYVGIQTDITSMKRVEEQVSLLASELGKLTP